VFILRLCVSEEILHTSKAHWLSEDSKLLAYIQFNDTSVPLEKFPFYSDASNMYTSFMQVPYPKVAGFSQLLAYILLLLVVLLLLLLIRSIAG